MGQLEVLSALAPHARYAVLSQETEPALGWAYTGFLSELSNNPGITGAELGQSIVESYIEDDQRIVDDDARRDWWARLALGWLFGERQRALRRPGGAPDGPGHHPHRRRPGSHAGADRSLNDLAGALQDADQRRVAQARSYAQSFTSIFGKDVPAAYIDLGNFAAAGRRAPSGQRRM